jgi:hypothetical protein
MAGTLRLSNTGTGNGQSTITTAASGDTTYTLPSGGGTFVTTSSTQALTVPFASGTVSAPSVTFLGDSNTGIYSPGADTIAFTEGGVESLRIDSSGRVGIGTTSPTSALHIDVASGEPLRFRSQTSGSNYFAHVNNAGGDLAYVGAGGGAALNSGTTSDYAIRANQGALLFGTNGNNERARIDSSGRLLVGTSTATANGGVLELSGGITFPATAVAASNANTLDDYEEGTWSPTVTAGSGSFTTVSTSGRYVKIGKTCLIACQINIGNAGTAAGAITVTNPPFNAAANDFFCGAVADRQTTLAQGGYAKFQSSTSFSVVKYDGTTFIASGNQLIVTIYIETA